jgi:hypothetical protein
VDTSRGSPSPASGNPGGIPGSSPASNPPGAGATGGDPTGRSASAPADPLKSTDPNKKG